MRNCRQCGRKVYGHNETCPYCGAAMFGTVNSIQTNTTRNSSDRKSHEIPVGGSYASWSSSQSEMAGITNSTQMNVVKTYGEEKFHGARGHGFAAERANDLYDSFTGKNATIVGDDNAKNGADRIVNGTNIQSKYCSSGSKCIRECFDGNRFRYLNADGSPMQIEVPADKYDDAVKAMQDRIDKGQVPGVKDAKEIVRKGNVTYEQAKNIAKAGTVESLTYDAASGIKIGAYSGGISAAITFAKSSWDGKSFEEALDDSVAAGLQTGGVAWANSILVGQMTKAGINSMLVPYTDAVINMIGPKASAHLANAFREGTRIYGGAAMKSASKILRGNVVTGIATVAIMSAGDVVDIFRGRISGSQLIKNVVNTGAEVAGGIGGWATGAVAGAPFGPVGIFIGGIGGALLGSTAAGKASKAVTDEFIEDDAKEMVRILESVFPTVSNDYILNKSEVKQVSDKLSGSDLKDMYASNDRKTFATNLLANYAASVVSKRKKIYLPSTQDYVRGLRRALE